MDSAHCDDLLLLRVPHGLHELLPVDRTGMFCPGDDLEWYRAGISGCLAAFAVDHFGSPLGLWLVGVALYRFVWLRTAGLFVFRCRSLLPLVSGACNGI